MKKEGKAHGNPTLPSKKREEKRSEKRTKFFYCKKVLEILRTAGTIMDVIWDFDDVLESCISVS